MKAAKKSFWQNCTWLPVSSVVRIHLYSDFFYPFYDIKGKKRFYEFIAYWRGLKFIRRLVERSYLQFIFLA